METATPHRSCCTITYRVIRGTVAGGHRYLSHVGTVRRWPNGRPHTRIIDQVREAAELELEQMVPCPGS